MMGACRRPRPSSARSPTPTRSRCSAPCPATRRWRSCTAGPPTRAAGTRCWPSSRSACCAAVTGSSSGTAGRSRRGRGRRCATSSRGTRWRAPRGCRSRAARWAGSATSWGATWSGCRARPPTTSTCPTWRCFYDVVVAFDNAARRAWIVSSGLPEADARRPDRPAAARLDHAAGVRRGGPAGPPPARRRRRPHVQLHAGRLRGGRPPGGRIHPGRRHLPGQPVPALPGHPPGWDAVGPVPAPAPRQPGAVRGVRDGDDVVVASASPERFLRAATGAGRDAADQGHPAARRHARRGRRALGRGAARQREGPGRERDDRRPAAQRSGPGVPRRHACAMPRAVRAGDATPPSITWSRRSPASCARAWTRSTCCAAAFPGGSITGAPKMRAMEIIAELEPTARGALLRRLGYLGFDGCDGHEHPHPHVRRPGRAAGVPGRRRHRRRLRPGGRVRGDAGQGAGR